MALTVGQMGGGSSLFRSVEMADTVKCSWVGGGGISSQGVRSSSSGMVVGSLLERAPPVDT